MNKYIVLPDCSDLNRGDQALVWETIRLAKDAGFEGDYYIQSEPLVSKQSIENGIGCFLPILKHPSRNNKTNNVKYGKMIKFKWGLIALFDLITSLFVLFVAPYKWLWILFGKDTKNTLNLYKESSAAFVKGGGFLQSYGGITTFYFIYYHLFPIYLANRMKLPVYIMPNSFGPLDGFSAKWQVRKALKKCKHITCRESISYNYMKSIFPDINFRLTDDLGFYLQPDTNTKFPFDNKNNLIAITARPYRFPEHNENNEIYYRKYVDSIADVAKHIYSKGYMPVFVQHTLAINAHEDDKKCIDDVCKLLNPDQYLVIENREYNCKQLKQVYSHFNAIIGTRFHSVIFSVASCVPALAIAYGGNKSRGIMRDNGLEQYVIDIDAVTGKSLSDMFDKIIENSSSYANHLNSSYKAIMQRRKEYVEELKYNRKK